MTYRDAQALAPAIQYPSGVTPETTAALIDALATDKAVRLKTLSKATVVLATMPVWVRAEEANALFGVPQNKLYDWVIEKKVIARKCDPDVRGSATIYKVESILRTLESLMDYRQWLIERPDLKGEERAAWESKNKNETEDQK